MVLMNGLDYIDLDSVGSTFTKDLKVFPQDITEAPTTASEADEMMGVNVFECDDEWYYNLSLVDGYNLISFLDENLDIEAELMGGFNAWKERVEGLIGSYDTFVGVA